MSGFQNIPWRNKAAYRLDFKSFDIRATNDLVGLILMLMD